MGKMDIFDISMDEKAKQCVMRILKISEEDIRSMKRIGGLTNINYLIHLKRGNYVFRYPGEQSNRLISRDNEYLNSRRIQHMGIDAHVVYLHKVSGIKITKYIEGGETLTTDTVKAKDNMRLIAAVLTQLHKAPIQFVNVFDGFRMIVHYENLLKQVNGENFQDYQEVRSKMKCLKSWFDHIGMTLVPCHNDTVSENFIRSKDRLFLIDWEYCGMNDAMWDIGSLFLECNFNEKQQNEFLDIYFCGERKERECEKILPFMICQDVLWSLWSRIKEAGGVDFRAYGQQRYVRAKKNLDLLFIQRRI